MQLAAVQIQLPNMEGSAAHDEHAGGGAHDHLLLVEALHLLHAGDHQALPPVQRQAVLHSTQILIRHSKTSHTYLLTDGRYIWEVCPLYA